jgi:hypothetical protein
MRFQENTLKIWFTPEEVAAAGIDKQIAEMPTAKDRLVTHEEQGFGSSETGPPGAGIA